jgi:hypothetical protein
MPSKKPKRVNWWVRYYAPTRMWRIYRSRRKVDYFAIKANAVKVAVSLIEKSGELAELHILRRDGEIQDKRTYPRASDPRGSKG